VKGLALVCDECFVQGSKDAKAALERLATAYWRRLEEIERRLARVERLASGRSPSLYEEDY
jgi:hypothetical protein